MKLDGKSPEYVEGYLEALRLTEEAVRGARLFFVTHEATAELARQDKDGKIIIKMMESVFDSIIGGVEKARKHLNGESE